MEITIDYQKSDKEVIIVGLPAFVLQPFDRKTYYPRPHFPTTFMKTPVVTSITKDGFTTNGRFYKGT